MTASYTDSQIATLSTQVLELNDQITALNAQLELKDQTINNQVTQIETLTAQLEVYQDDMPPVGSLYVADDWASNGKSLALTFSGHVWDELSMIRDGVGCGVYEAYLLINGTDTIPLTLDDMGKFSGTHTMATTRNTVVTTSLYAKDTKPDMSNHGLVDEVTVKFPKIKRK